MWSIMFGIYKNLKKALKKHPTFPERIVNPHTTYRAMVQSREYFQRMNDAGRETVASVINEEVGELLCEMHKRRWRRAEKEWLDVVSVLIRTYFIIKRKKKERYNEIMSYIRYRRMLKVEKTEQTTFLHDCSACPHNNNTGGVVVCAIGFNPSSGGVCPLDVATKKEDANAK